MKPAEPRYMGPAGQSGISESKQAPYTAPPPAPQQPQQLGAVARRIVERLDRRRSGPNGAVKRNTQPTAAEQHDAAFHDPRQMQLSLNPQPQGY